MFEGRMRSLLQAYKAARDNNNRTGSSPCFAPYMELMDEIFGSSPIISNTHTLQLGEGPVQMLEDDSETPAPSSSVPQLSPLSSTSSSLSHLSTLPSTSSSMSPTPAKRKRSARELYYEEKLKLKKKHMKKKTPRRKGRRNAGASSSKVEN